MAAILSMNKARSQVVSLLQASRTAYATTVDSSKRQFSSDTEIDDAILFADGEYATAICETPGHPFTNAFLLLSSALAHGATIPSHMGRIVNVTHCDTSGGTYLQSIAASSREDVLEMRSNTAMFGTAAYQLEYYFIEDALIYMVDAFSKIQYTDYVRTSAAQCPESLASGVVAGAIARLLKDGSDDAMAGYYRSLFENGIAMVRQGAKQVPDIVAYK